MEDEAGIDAQKLQPWYPSVWWDWKREESDPSEERIERPSEPALRAPAPAPASVWDEPGPAEAPSVSTNGHGSLTAQQPAPAIDPGFGFGGPIADAYIPGDDDSALSGDEAASIVDDPGFRMPARVAVPAPEEPAEESSEAEDEPNPGPDLADILQEEEFEGGNFRFDVWADNSPAPSASEPSEPEDQLEMPDRWAFAARSLRTRAPKAPRRQSSAKPFAAALDEPIPSEQQEAVEPEPVHAALAAMAPVTAPAPRQESIPEPASDRQPGASAPRRWRHRRGRTPAVAEMEPAFFAAEGDSVPLGGDGEPMLVGMPEGSRLTSVLRLLGIAIPVAGLTMAFLAFVR